MNNAIIASSLQGSGAASNITNNYFSGYMGASGSWSSSSHGSFADGANVGGNTLTTLFSNNLSVVAAGSSLAGIVFTPASSASVYMIEAIVCLYENATNSGGAAALSDGNNLFAFTGYNQTATLANMNPCLPLRGIYAGGTTSPVTIKVQLQSASGTVFLQNDMGIQQVPTIQWTVFQLN